MSILNSFIKSPQLQVYNTCYPFIPFNFHDEEIAETGFDFPATAVLGMQAEACFEAYLRRSKNYEVLASNIQIPKLFGGKNNSGKITLGEFDYIVKCRESLELCHIELAYKFYLYNPNEECSELKKWIGPNKKDSLFQKLEKLKWKQFPLLENPIAIDYLNKLDIKLPTSQQLCLKTHLFVPKGFTAGIWPSNYRECVVGYWIRPGEMEHENKSALYAMPDKKQWLLPPSEAPLDWCSYDMIVGLIECKLADRISPLIYEKSGSAISSFFVVWW